MRRVVTVIAILAVLACVAASAVMNWLFMTSLGRTEVERQVFGVVSLAVSGFLSALPVLIMWARNGSRVVAALMGVLLFIVCAAVSVSSAVGFAASNRGETTGGRESVTAKLIAAQKALGDAELRLKAIPFSRPAGIVAEAIEGTKQNRLWSASRECQESQSAAMRDFCKGYFALKAERASGEEAGILHAKIDQLRAEIDGLRDKGAGRAADAQADVIGLLLGIGTERAQQGLTVLLAVVVELMASFGFYLATPHTISGGETERGKRADKRDLVPMIDVTPTERRRSGPTVGQLVRRAGALAPAVESAGPRRIKLNRADCSRTPAAYKEKKAKR